MKLKKYQAIFFDKNEMVEFEFFALDLSAARNTVKHLFNPQFFDVKEINK